MLSWTPEDENKLSTDLQKLQLENTSTTKETDDEAEQKLKEKEKQLPNNPTEFSIQPDPHYSRWLIQDLDCTILDHFVFNAMAIALQRMIPDLRCELASSSRKYRSSHDVHDLPFAKNHRYTGPGAGFAINQTADVFLVLSHNMNVEIPEIFIDTLLFQATAVAITDVNRHLSCLSPATENSGLNRMAILAGYYSENLCLACDQIGHIQPHCPNGGSMVCPNCKEINHAATQCESVCRFCDKHHPGRTIIQCIRSVVQYHKSKGNSNMLLHLCRSEEIKRMSKVVKTQESQCFARGFPTMATVSSIKSLIRTRLIAEGTADGNIEISVWRSHQKALPVDYCIIGLSDQKQIDTLLKIAEINTFGMEITFEPYTEEKLYNIVNSK